MYDIFITSQRRNIMQKNSTGEAEISAKTLSETFEDTAEQMRRQFIEDLSGGLIKYYTWDMHKNLLDKKLESLISGEKHDEALALIKELSEKFPQDKTYFGKAAEIYRRQKNYAMALEMCEKKLSGTAYSSSLSFWSMAAGEKMEILEESGKSKEAEDFFDSIMSNEEIPEKEKSIAARARFQYLHENGREEDALSLCGSPYAGKYLSDGKAWLLEKLGRDEEALAETNKALEKEISYCTDGWDYRHGHYSNKMNLLCKMGRFSEAMELVHIMPHREAEIAFFTERKKAIEDMRLEFENTLMPKKALEFCMRLENREMFATSIIFLLGENGEYEKAIDFCENYLFGLKNRQNNPYACMEEQFEEAENIKLDLLEKLGRVDERISFMREILSSCKDTFRKGKLAIDLAYTLAKNGRLGEAEELLPLLEKEDISFPGRKSAAAAIQALILIRKGETEHGLKLAADIALKHQPGTNYALVYEILNACGIIDKILETSRPEHSKMQDFLVNAANDILNHDEYDKAISLLDKVLEIWPDCKKAQELKEEAIQGRDFQYEEE